MHVLDIATEEDLHGWGLRAWRGDVRGDDVHHRPVRPSCSLRMGTHGEHAARLDPDGEDTC
jgi:hypothetical protein